MRLAILSDLAPGGVPAGGVERAVATLAAALGAEGVDLTVFAPDPAVDGPSPSDAYPFPVTRVPMPGRAQVLRGFRPWTERVHGSLADYAPDIVHAHGLLHNGVAAARWADCPVVVTAHGDPIADAREHYAAPVHRAVLPMLRRAVRTSLDGADRVVDVTSEWWVNLPRKPHGFVHIANAIEPVFFGRGKPGPRPRVLYFGDMRRIKGLDLLLQAWPTVSEDRPDVELHVFGMDEKGRALAEAAGRESRGVVHAHPPVPTAEVADWMAEGGVVVVPSRYEVAPLVVPEAWASGVPLVATAVGGIPSMARNAAYLCEPEPQSIADAVFAALEGGPIAEARIAIGADRALDHRPETVAAAHLELYRELIEGRRL